MVTNFLPNWIEPIIAIVGVFGVLGGASAYFSQNRARNVIDLQKEELQIAKDTNARLTAELTAKEKERQYMTEKIDGLEKQVALLQGIVTAAPQIAKLSQDVVKQHREVVQSLSDIAKLLTEGQKNA